jgi:hypothetical protein
MSITLPSTFEMLCPQSVFMERPYIFSLDCNVFAWFLVFDSVMVDDTRQYELLSAKHNCRIVKGSSHPNSIICGTLCL